MISKKLLAKSALVVAMAAVSVTAFATHSWNGYHWARTTPSFDLQTLDSTVNNSNAPWASILATAASQWSVSNDLNLIVTPYTNTLTARKRCSPVVGKIRVCNASYGNTGWLGLASINIDGNGHILQGTARMNDTYGSTYINDPNEAKHVLCQEVGHTFGLGHTSENGTTQNTCMDYSNSPTSTAPNQHDYDELDIVYGHADSFNSYNASSRLTVSSAPSSAQSEMTTAVPFGPLVSKGHFSETHVAPDGKGGLWVTHVTLAPGFEHMATQ